MGSLGSVTIAGWLLHRPGWRGDMPLGLALLLLLLLLPLLLLLLLLSIHKP